MPRGDGRSPRRRAGRTKADPPAGAIVLHPRDNVATALVPLAAGHVVAVEVDGRQDELAIVSTVPQGHKFALTRLPPGAAVVKYGEPIGLSTREIARGEHVHVHNVGSRSKSASEAVPTWVGPVSAESG